MKSIFAKEIFSVGTWNGDVYTAEDLDEMVKAFKAHQTTFKPPLKLGHDDKQELLQRDGYPAAGWIGNVYRQGEKLLADFIDIPNKIYELLEKGAYKNVSSEIYWDIEVNGTTYPRMLAGVALLGADVPAVLNLSDIMSYYEILAPAKKIYADEKKQPNIKTYRFNESAKGDAMTEQEIQQMNDRLKALEAVNAENVELKKFKSDAEAQLKTSAEKITELQKDSEESKLDANVTEIVATRKFSAAMKPFLKALLGSEKKEYAIGEKKDLSKKAVLEGLLDAHAECLKLNTNEKTVGGDKIPQDEAKDKAIKEYAAKNKCSYGDAYRAVMKEQVTQ